MFQTEPIPRSQLAGKSAAGQVHHPTKTRTVAGCYWIVPLCKDLFGFPPQRLDSKGWRRLPGERTMMCGLRRRRRIMPCCCRRLTSSPYNTLETTRQLQAALLPLEARSEVWRNRSCIHQAGIAAAFRLAVFSHRSWSQNRSVPALTGMTAEVFRQLVNMC